MKKKSSVEDTGVLARPARTAAPNPKNRFTSARFLAYHSSFSCYGGTDAQAVFPDLLPLVVRDAASLTNAPDRNDSGKQERHAGTRPCINLRIESQHAAPGLHRCGHDSGLRR